MKHLIYEKPVKAHDFRCVAVVVIWESLDE